MCGGGGFIVCSEGNTLSVCGPDISCSLWAVYPFVAVFICWEKPLPVIESDFFSDVPALIQTYIKSSLVTSVYL